MRKLIVLFILVHGVLYNDAQTIGGSTVYNFLNLSNTPQLTGLGGVNISNITNDIGLAFNNPSLLKPSMHTQADLVFNSFYAGIKNYHFMAGFRSEPLKTNLAFGINYFSYGSVTQTDPSGIVYGDFTPSDYVMQVSASREYGQKWEYGTTLKFIHSNYGQYRSSGLAMDIGVSYYDSASLFQASLVAKNMGAQVRVYTGASAGDLPFDLQLGVTKRLAKAPLQFSLTAYHLQQFNIRYSDTLFNNVNGFDQNSNGKKFIFDKIFRHIVLATQLYIGDKLEISVGYNYLRRKELNIGNAGNGLNGFSLGVGVLFKKIQIRYARSYYQNNSSYNQFGLNLKLNDYFGLGKVGKNIGW